MRMRRVLVAVLFVAIGFLVGTSEALAGTCAIGGPGDLCWFDPECSSPNRCYIDACQSDDCDNEEQILDCSHCEAPPEI